MTTEMSWPPEVDHYMATIQGLPAQISVDLGARPLAPVGSLPVRLMVRVVMKHPRDDGLRSEDEDAALADLEFQLKQAVEVGRRDRPVASVSPIDRPVQSGLRRPAYDHGHRLPP